MNDYLFYDEVTGEEFLVEVDTLKEALDIAKRNFEKPKWIDTLTPEEGEILGLDTY